MASSSPLREQLPNSALEPLLQTVMKEPFKLGEIGIHLHHLVIARK